MGRLSTIWESFGLMPLVWDRFWQGATAGGYKLLAHKVVLDTGVTFDTFERTVTTGWGTSDTGSEYSYWPLSGDGADARCSVANGVGRLESNDSLNPGYPQVYFGPNRDSGDPGPWTASQWTLSLRMKTPAWVDFDDFAELLIETNSRIVTLTMGLDSDWGDTGWIETDEDGSQEVFPWQSETWYRLRWRYDNATGDSWLKVWLDGDAEPDWMITISSYGGLGGDDPTTFMYLYARSSRDGGSVYYFDDITFDSPTGQLAHLPIPALIVQGVGHFDTFDRTVASNYPGWNGSWGSAVAWGQSDYGYYWYCSSTADSLAVSNGIATVDVSSDQNVQIYTPSTSISSASPPAPQPWADTFRLDTRFRFPTLDIDSYPNDDFPCVFIAIDSGWGTITVGFRVTVSQQGNIILQRIANTAVAATDTAAYTFVAGDWFSMAMAYDGANLAAKVWNEADTEPDWLVSVAATSPVGNGNASHMMVNAGLTGTGLADHIDFGPFEFDGLPASPTGLLAHKVVLS